MKKSKHQQSTKKDHKASAAFEEAKTQDQSAASETAEESGIQKLMESLRSEQEADPMTEFQKQCDIAWEETKPKYRKFAAALQADDLAEFTFAVVHEIRRRLSKEKIIQEYTEEEERNAALEANLPGKVPKLSGAHILGIIADLSLASLRFAALKGHKVGAEKFCEMLQGYVECLNEDALKSPKLYLKEAQTSCTWPVLYSPNSSLGSDVKELQEKLRIGKLQILNLKPNQKGKLWSIETPTNEVAINLIHTMLEVSWNAHTGKLKDMLAELQEIEYPKFKEKLENWLKKSAELPFFGLDSLDEWAPHAWEFIRIYTNGHPENYEGLKELGKARKGMGKSHERARIKEELMSAMSRLVAIQPGVLLTNASLKFYKSVSDYVRRHSKITSTTLLRELLQIEESFMKNFGDGRGCLVARFTLINLMKDDVPFDKLRETAMAGMDRMNSRADAGTSPFNSTKPSGR